MRRRTCRPDRRGRGVGARGAGGSAARARRGAARALRARLGSRPCADARSTTSASASARLSDAAVYIAESPERVAGQRLVWRGEMDARARDSDRLLGFADERGEPFSYALHAPHLCELELRAGDWEAAGGCSTSGPNRPTASCWSPPMYERCRALLAAGRGRPDEAERVGGRGDRRARSRPASAGICSRRSGRAGSPPCSRTSRRAPPTACGASGSTPCARVWTSPAPSRSLPSSSRRSSTRRARRGTRGRRPPARAGRAAGASLGAGDARRCAALDPAGGGALDGRPPHGSRRRRPMYARARPVLRRRAVAARPRPRAAALSSGARRATRWRRRSPRSSAIGSPGWAERARAELARVGARRPRADRGADPDRARVVELAAEGLANKEIAQALFVTVHTVEGAPLARVLEARGALPLAARPPPRRQGLTCGSPRSTTSTATSRPSTPCSARWSAPALTSWSGAATWPPGSCCPPRRSSACARSAAAA